MLHVRGEHARRRVPSRRVWVVFAVGLALALGGAVVRLTLGPDVPAARASGSTSPSSEPKPTFPTTWKRYAPDGSFRVVAPSPPQEGQQQAVFGVIHQARFPSPDGELYGVLWFDVPPETAAGAKDAQLVDAWVTNVLGTSGARSTRRTSSRTGHTEGWSSAS